MKIHYKFIIDDDGFPKITSNLKVDGLDMLELLSSDIVDRTYQTFLNCMDRKKYWWSNATKVEFYQGDAIISPAFQWSEGAETKVYIPIKVLKKILKEWIEFLKSNN